jgi:hypothetical protein
LLKVARWPRILLFSFMDPSKLHNLTYQCFFFFNVVLAKHSFSSMKSTTLTMAGAFPHAFKRHILEHQGIHWCDCSALEVKALNSASLIVISSQWVTTNIYFRSYCLAFDYWSTSSLLSMRESMYWRIS